MWLLRTLPTLGPIGPAGSVFEEEAWWCSLDERRAAFSQLYYGRDRGSLSSPASRIGLQALGFLRPGAQTQRRWPSGGWLLRNRGNRALTAGLGIRTSATAQGSEEVRNGHGLLRIDAFHY